MGRSWRDCRRNCAPPYRDGNFSVGLKDHEFQVIPAAWIEAAQNRWRENGGLRQAMTAIGVDVAQGGPARGVVAPRHGGWYAAVFGARFVAALNSCSIISHGIGSTMIAA